MGSNDRMMKRKAIPNNAKPIAPLVVPLSKAKRNMTKRITPIANSSKETSMPFPPTKEASIS
jgi:hypothetical protein